MFHLCEEDDFLIESVQVWMLSDYSIQNLSIHSIKCLNFELNLLFFNVFSSLTSDLIDEGLAKIWP